MKNILGSRVFGGFVLILLATVFFALGYWNGERAQRTQAKSDAANQADLPAGIDRARLNQGHPAVPANATPEMKEFLQNQIILSDKMDEVRHNAPNGAFTPQMAAQFNQQNDELIRRQRQLSQMIAQQRRGNNMVVPTPPPVHIPPNASPQLKDYLSARDELLREQIAFMNQHSSDNPAARAQAVDQWRQQNADRFKQLQQMAQRLAPAQTSANTATFPPSTPPKP